MENDDLDGLKDEMEPLKEILTNMGDVSKLADQFLENAMKEMRSPEGLSDETFCRVIRIMCNVDLKDWANRREKEKKWTDAVLRELGSRSFMDLCRIRDGMWNERDNRILQLVGKAVLSLAIQARLDALTLDGMHIPEVDVGVESTMKKIQEFGRAPKDPKEENE